MELYEYQKNIVNQIVLRKKIALWLDMGLGKTIICLKSVEWLIQKGKIKNVLVIAPKTVAETVWKQESEQWKLNLSLSLVIGNEKQREKALQKKADIYVISRDNLAWLFLQKFSAQMLIFDESTSIKDRSTQRWASLCQKSVTYKGKKYRRNLPMIDMFERIVLLSGTPCSESYQGLWAQIYLLDKGFRLGKTISEFRRNYMIPQMFNGFPVYQKMLPGAIDAINKKLEDICISMKSEDYLQLPEKIDIIRNVGSKNEFYKKMERDGVVKIDNIDILAGDTLSRYTKLLQITSGFLYDEQGNVHKINNDKLNVVKEIVETSEENILIFYKYQYEKNLLMEIGGVPLESAKTIENWKNGKIKIGLLYPASGGYGLNLATGGNVGIWYTLPLSLEQYLQTNKRIHRQGQKNSVRIYHLICKNTIDEKVYNLLKNKKDVLDGLMEYFKN